jgi:hypothetical protein
LWQHLKERERLLKLGVDGKMAEMQLVTMSVILMVWLTVNGEYCYKLRSRAQSKQELTNQSGNSLTLHPPKRRIFDKLTVAH